MSEEQEWAEVPKMKLADEVRRLRAEVEALKAAEPYTKGLIEQLQGEAASLREALRAWHNLPWSKSESVPDTTTVRYATWLWRLKLDEELLTPAPAPQKPEELS